MLRPLPWKLRSTIRQLFIAVHQDIVFFIALGCPSLISYTAKCLLHNSVYFAGVIGQDGQNKQDRRQLLSLI